MYEYLQYFTKCSNYTARFFSVAHESCSSFYSNQAKCTGPAGCSVGVFINGEGARLLYINVLLSVDAPSTATATQPQCDQTTSQAACRPASPAGSWEWDRTEERETVRGLRAKEGKVGQLSAMSLHNQPGTFSCACCSFTPKSHNNVFLCAHQKWLVRGVCGETGDMTASQKNVFIKHGWTGLTTLLLHRMPQGRGFYIKTWWFMVYCHISHPSARFFILSGPITCCVLLAAASGALTCNQRPVCVARGAQ